MLIQATFFQVSQIKQHFVTQFASFFGSEFSDIPQLPFYNSMESEGPYKLYTWKSIQRRGPFDYQLFYPIQTHL